jgi:hypothetical protein
MLLYHDNFCNRDSFKIAQQLTSGYKQKGLSQFLHHTKTVLSCHKTSRPFTKSVIPALDKSCNRDNFVFRRDLQKLHHDGLPAGTISRLKYLDSYRRTAPPTLSAHTRWPLAFIVSYLQDS